MQDVVLRAGGRIEGQLLDTSGAPRPGVAIHLGSVVDRPAGSRTWKTATGDDGRFGFGGLAAGLYRVSQLETREGMAPYQRTTLRAGLDAGERVEVSFAAAGTGRISGRVTGVEHLPPDALVELLPIDAGAGPPARLDRAPHRKGVFMFEGVPAGTYRLRVFHVGRSSLERIRGTQEVQVQDGGSHTVRLEVTHQPR